MAERGAAESIAAIDAIAAGVAAAMRAWAGIIGDPDAAGAPACLADRRDAERAIGRTVIAGAAGRSAAMTATDFSHIPPFIFPPSRCCPAFRADVAGNVFRSPGLVIRLMTLGIGGCGVIPVFAASVAAELDPGSAHPVIKFGTAFRTNDHDSPFFARLSDFGVKPLIGEVFYQSSSFLGESAGRGR